MLRGSRLDIALVLALLCLLYGGWAQAQEPGATLPDNLADFRALAVDLRKTGPGKDTAVGLEYRMSRPSNACAGDEPESILRLHGDGRLSLLVTRSFRVTEVHGPGRFSGRVPRARWDSAFARFAAMKWVEQSFLPMPGMSESHLTLRLKRAGKEAEFTFAGALPPDQTLISKGVAAAEDFKVEAWRDTAWSLRLTAIKTKVGPSGLSLESLWTNRGRQAVRIRLPSSAKTPSCGTLELTWSAPPSREPGVTPLPPDVHGAFPKASPILSGAWKEIGPGDTARLPVAIPIPFPDSKW